ncbi:MAG: alpha hydrolase [Euryarchaeota archaeon]|nr:alpha hydrolase [Euryarchaeota archaeon]
MNVFVLFSGGKDSSLSAILLEPFFEVRLITCSFGFRETWKPAKDVASELGFPHEILRIDDTILESAYDIAIDDGYPNRAINYIHQCALRCAASEHPVLADGTRRDDRVPMLNLADVQRLEDRYGCMYIRPLLGYGRRAVDALVNIHLEIVEDESERIEKSDYEAELRAIIEERDGPEMVHAIFPGHVQSRVIRRKHDHHTQIPAR